MALNTFTKGPMACFETLGIDFAESQFGLHRANAGFIVAVMGTFGSLLLLLIAKVSDYLNIDDAQLTNGGISIFIMGVVMNTFLDKENVENNQTWRYVFSIFLCYGIGYPICHTALISLFSKIVGRRPQGTLQGWFSASGSIGRVSFPIMSGYVVSNFDIETLFYILSVVLGCSVFFLLHFRSVFSRLSSS
jgi:ceroid-lipofuscinosis MFS transporter 7